MSARRGLNFLKARYAQPGAPRFGKHPLHPFSRPGAADARALVRIDDDAGDGPSPTLVQTDACLDCLRLEGAEHGFAAQKDEAVIGAGWPASSHGYFPSSLSTINSVLSGAVGYYRFSELTKISLLVLAAAWQHYPVELYVNDSPRSRELGVELMRTGLDRLLQETSRPGLHTIVLSDVALQPSVAIGCIMATSGVILRRDCTSNIFKTPRERVENAHAATNAIIRALPEPWPNVSALVGEAPCERPDGEAL
jgi:hypothetical protein